MVGILLDGRDCGPGAHAFADDVARLMACDAAPTHLFFLVPAPVQSPRVHHSVIRPGKPAARLDPGFDLSGEDVALQTSMLNPREFSDCCESLAQQLMPHLVRHGLTALHAIGLDFPASVAQLLHKRSGVPFFVTPRGRDLTREEGRFQTRARAALLEASGILTFDEETRRGVESRFEFNQERLSTSVLGRGIDLERFQPLRRAERSAVADDLTQSNNLAVRLDDVDWERAFIILAVAPRDDRHGFEQFLFAIPELLRVQPSLQVIVIGGCEPHPVTDGLRAALAAGRPELLHDVVKTSELCQPLVDHLERLHQEGRAEAWWDRAARLEPERRVRFLGRTTREEFTTLLRMSDLFVVPGTTVRPPSQMFYEALACGVLPLASELAGIRPLVESIASEISVEIAALCLLKTGVQPVREMEEKIGRIIRLRPELTVRLRSLAEERFNGQQLAAELRRAYEQPVRTAATRS